MRVEHGVPLAPLTTLGLGGPAKRLVEAGNARELGEALAMDDKVLVIGGGSNLVIGDAGFDGTALRVAMKGTFLIDHGGATLADGFAAEVWDDFVALTIDAGLAGLEGLSGIPGLVGATPIQNVGAYGQEVADTLLRVVAYDRELPGTIVIRPDQCEFAYRTSVFRGTSRWIIMSVRFRLERSPLSRPIRYAELAKAVGVREGERAPTAVVREAVLALRRSKGMVLDPADPESRSAGSFFTNPIVASEVAARLPADAPRWPQPDGRVKLAAAWLIERAGFSKGHTEGAVGISRKHALALVNRGGATATELLGFARRIQDGVRAAFGIALAPEPVIVE